ncbi:hypothetical protein CH296_00545 [Rhodococcus sp. 14-2496-1d]|uniref:hypothetical protein n=1 Tax=Rhodococcus sp. 14-2496-1d TaxID=2023146 RepID=UPI000B9C0297|nr:hypothetical protein [Rhodococcus sp. 14-2496-1d]OZF40779.1 hypothetical protein CH296_00545 [Rhodococcus sp. 14-2496-1d]
MSVSTKYRGQDLRIGGEYVVEVRRHRSHPNLVACRIVGGGELIMDGEALADLLRSDWATEADTDPYEGGDDEDDLPIAASISSMVRENFWPVAMLLVFAVAFWLAVLIKAGV